MNVFLHHWVIVRVATAVIVTYVVADWWLRQAMAVALVLTGVAIIAVVLTLAAGRIIAMPPTVMLATAGVALVLTGVVTGPSWQTSLDAVFAVLGAIGIFLVGTGAKLPVRLRILCAGTALTALTAYLAVVTGHTGSLAAETMQRLSIYPVLVSVLALGWHRSRVPEPVLAVEADGVPV